MESENDMKCNRKVCRLVSLAMALKSFVHNRDAALVLGHLSFKNLGIKNWRIFGPLKAIGLDL